VGSATTNTPHDALFKASFEAPEHAAPLFRQILAEPIVAAIDWTTLRREAGSFIDPTLAASHNDLLFSARLVLAPELKILLYVMAEHQSRSRHDMCLRVLGYMVRGWERYWKEHTGPLPVIIPFVLSHDPEGWTAPISFHDLFGLGPDGSLAMIPQLAKFVPSFELQLEDLIEIDDEQLYRWQLTTFGLLTLQLLRDTRNPERVQQSLPAWAESARLLTLTPNGQRDIEQVFRYIWLVAGQLRFEEFHEIICQLAPETKEVAMTIAEQLRAEGEAKGEVKGRAEGRAEGRLHALKKQMTLKFGPLSAEHAARLTTMTEQQLDLYLERILFASTLEDVFGSD
jgi:predicted transposase/invertase (TIGR01784 family)